MDEQKKQGKISRILKIVLISFLAFILLLAIIPKSSENWKESYEAEKSSYESYRNEMEEYKLKMEQYKESMSPYEELAQVEAEVRLKEANALAESYAESEAASIAESEAKAREESIAESEAQAEADRIAQSQAEEQERIGYDTGISYDQLARNPDDFINQKVKFTGKVLQVVESSSGINAMRFAVNKDYNHVLYIEYNQALSSSRILEDDILTIYGVAQGLYSYTATMGQTITIPKVHADKIEANS